MPKNWDFYKDEIENLYIKQGYTLGKVRDVMVREHNFTASTRSYKMKLDEWKMWKYRSKTGDQSHQSDFSSIMPEPVQSSSSTPSPRKYFHNSVEGHYNSDLSSPSTQSESHTYQPFSPVTSSSSSSSVTHFAQSSSHRSSMSQDLSGLSLQEDPLINSSLMFFSTRTDTESLRLLSISAELAPRALEILLRNWEPGGEFFKSAIRFLQQSNYCQTIVGVNWTRWNHRDETLFDLVDENVLEDEQPQLFVALFTADLKFGHELAQLNAPWATSWRSASQQRDWGRAKDYLAAMGVHHLLWQCAFVVIAKGFLERNNSRIRGWVKGTPFPEGSHRQNYAILDDCREFSLGTDSWSYAHLWGCMDEEQLRYLFA
ncbi:Clr5 domain-containing protein [Leptodontidium sp. MPI-SDFR-AT-0119]|nr:Clr5 domain-containing protein [Leptodontidium sp. MPI-SDFR-AT-0119]